MVNADILSKLELVIASRKGGDIDQSYVAKLFHRGRKKMAQKVGEEGVEAALAAVLGDKDDVIAESADLLFHLMILWADMDITADDVFNELARREGISGIEEPKSRNQ